MKSSISSALGLGAISFFTAQFCAIANPLGGVVASGTATISQAGSILTINQNSSRAIIDWNSFNIGSGQSTSFHFLGSAGSASAVLNEVSANAGPSFINGLLNSFVGPGHHAGGTVFIYNPNGLLIGPQGSIRVGSFVGTTLSLKDSSFMQGGNLTLGSASGTGAGSIQNQGQISALEGDIFLIAHSVENDGTLTARNVGLAAGSYVEIKQPGQPGADRISVLAGGSSHPGGTGVDNSATGLIKAVTIELQAAGGNAYALAVNNSGVIHADTLVSQGGHIYLTGNGGAVQNSGTLDASDTAAGGKGGTVQVTGSQVTLTGTSTINVNGGAGGGTVLIGGGSRGQDFIVSDATSTTVAAGSTISANAIIAGNGGHVVVWSDDTTTFGGQISARGGLYGGNGGSAEVSGAQTLDISGHADLTAPHGTIGTLLLDPGSVDIVSGANTSTEYNNGSTGDITDGWVNNQLTTASVAISTSDAGANGANAATLTVDGGAAISWNTASSLSLTGGSSVTVNGTITGTGTGGLTLSSPSGNIAINNTVSIAGGVSLNAATGIAFDGATSVGGNLALTAGGAVSQTAALTVAGTSSLNAGANPITLNTAGNDLAGTVTVDTTGANDVVINNGVNPLALNGTVGGNLTATGAGISDGGNLLTVGGTTSLTAGAGNAISLVGTAGDSLTGAVTINSGDNVTLDDTLPLTVNGTVSGNLTATGAGISDGGNLLTVGGTTSLTAGAGNAISLVGTAGDSLTGAVNIVSANNVTLDDTLPLTVNGTVSGNLTATGAGISDGGNLLTVGGTTSLTAGVGNAITLVGIAGDI